jgi:hypothetical protein
MKALIATMLSFFVFGSNLLVRFNFFFLRFFNLYIKLLKDKRDV